MKELRYALWRANVIIYLNDARVDEIAEAPMALSLLPQLDYPGAHGTLISPRVTS